MIKLICKLILITLASFLIILIFDFSYRKITNKEPFEIKIKLWRNKEKEERFKIVGLGNSHANDGFDFSHYNAKAINLGSVAQRFKLGTALLKQYKNQIDKNAIIIIDVSHISFSHEALDINDSLQEQFYDSMNPFFIPKLNLGNFLKKQIFPFTLTFNDIRKDYNKKLVDEESERNKKDFQNREIKNQLSEKNTKEELIKIINADANFYNVSIIELALQNPQLKSYYQPIDNMDFIFNKWYHTKEFDKKYFKQNIKDLEELISYINKNNWKAVLITIPVREVLEEGLLDDYKQIYLYDNLAKIRTKNYQYFDYTKNKSFTQNDLFFSNADHLSKNGAKVFNYLLIQDLIAQSYLEKEVDGYEYDFIKTK